MKSFKSFLEESQTFISGGFNIARCDMPQIDDQDAFIAHIESLGLIAMNTTIPTEVVKPTQIEFDQSKVDKMKSSNIIGSIIVADDLYILDGHHRYFATLQNNVKVINAYIVNVSINKLLKIAYEYLEDVGDG